MQKKISILLFLFCFSSFAEAQNVWTKRAAVSNSKRERSVGFSIGTRGYIALGQDKLNQMMNDLWEYDPGTNSWTQKANFPGQARRDAACFVIGMKAYVGTGINNADAGFGTALSDMWEYSPATNSWTAKASYPGAGGGGIYYASGFAVLGKGYFCGGKQSAFYYSNELWQYTPSTDSWTMKTGFPVGVRYGGSSFVVGNYAYFGCGTDENVLRNDFCKYDPTFDMWTVISPLPTSPRNDCASFSLDNEGYILGGFDGGFKDELWQYDPVANYWYDKALLTGGARRGCVAFTIGHNAYAGTGKGLTGIRRDFWEYGPTTPMGIEESINLISSIYPNPVVESCTVVLSENILNTYENLLWEITDINGKLISTDKITSTSFSVQRNDIAKGIYFFNLKTSTTIISTKKIIIQ